MTEQWKELKETIIELRDNDGTGTQQEVCKFLVNLMDVLEKQMSNQNKGDLISRQAVINAIANTIVNGESLGYGLAEEIVSEIPPTENKGEWIESKERSKHWYCSVCGGIHTDPETGKWRETFDFKYPFCPNCGADMRGKT